MFKSNFKIKVTIWVNCFVISDQYFNFELSWFSYGRCKRLIPNLSQQEPWNPDQHPVGAHQLGVVRGLLSGQQPFRFRIRRSHRQDLGRRVKAVLAHFLRTHRTGRRPLPVANSFWLLLKRGLRKGEPHSKWLAYLLLVPRPWVQCSAPEIFFSQNY